MDTYIHISFNDNAYFLHVFIVHFVLVFMTIVVYLCVFFYFVLCCLGDNLLKVVQIWSWFDENWIKKGFDMAMLRRSSSGRLGRLIVDVDEAIWIAGISRIFWFCGWISRSKSYFALGEYFGDIAIILGFLLGLEFGIWYRYTPSVPYW